MINQKLELSNKCLSRKMQLRIQDQNHGKYIRKFKTNKYQRKLKVQKNE